MNTKNVNRTIGVVFKEHPSTIKDVENLYYIPFGTSLVSIKSKYELSMISHYSSLNIMLGSISYKFEEKSGLSVLKSKNLGVFVKSSDSFLSGSVVGSLQDLVASFFQDRWIDVDFSFMGHHKNVRDLPGITLEKKISECSISPGNNFISGVRNFMFKNKCEDRLLKALYPSFENIHLNKVSISENTLSSFVKLLLSPEMALPVYHLKNAGSQTASDKAYVKSPSGISIEGKLKEMVISDSLGFDDLSFLNTNIDKKSRLTFYKFLASEPELTNANLHSIANGICFTNLMVSDWQQDLYTVYLEEKKTPGICPNIHKLIAVMTLADAGMRKSQKSGVPLCVATNSFKELLELQKERENYLKDVSTSKEDCLVETWKKDWDLHPVRYKDFLSNVMSVLAFCVKKEDKPQFVAMFKDLMGEAYPSEPEVIKSVIVKVDLSVYAKDLKEGFNLFRDPVTFYRSLHSLTQSAIDSVFDVKVKPDESIKVPLFNNSSAQENGYFTINQFGEYSVPESVGDLSLFSEALGLFIGEIGANLYQVSIEDAIAQNISMKEADEKIAELKKVAPEMLSVIFKKLQLERAMVLPGRNDKGEDHLENSSWKM